MKLRFVASTRDVVIFIVFALFLLYVVAIGVLNIPEIAAKGTFYGLNPLEAFSPNYISYTLIIYFIALVGLIMSVNSYFFEFEEGWGLKIGSSTKGGYSDWAKPKDIKNDKNVKRVLASAPKVDAAGTPLISNGKELWVDNGEYHTLVIGATGSGKTQDTILPTIKVLAKKGESVVVTDPKGEIYEKAGGLLKKNGYKIILLNFRNPQNGNTWNPLELPYRLYKTGNQDKAIELLDDLALNILYDETNQNSDPFWEKTAADYFAGIALAMFEDTTEDKININSINMTATVGEDKFGGSTYIKEYFSYKDPSSAAYVNASGTVMAPSETKGGIISVFKQKVKLFASRENLSEMLSYSDFRMDDIGKEPTAVFIIIQDEKRTYHPLATIFIKQVYETLIDVAQANGGKLPVRTNFLLDEFANMPPLKDVTTMITAARSRQIRFTMIIQNFAQLNKVYGKDDAETIKGNCGNIIYLISTELAALEEISKLCGEKKSKKDDKTASTPLVTVSDLQRMKQFDHILLRMRKSPFKTSFVPDFKIDWGNTDVPKVDYPVREKKPVSIFDIREFVKEKKNQKINEMMASIGGDTSSSSSNPFAGAAGGMSGGSSQSLFGNGLMGGMQDKKKPDLSVNDLVKKIDEKLAEIEKEEEEAKKKKEAQKKSIPTTPSKLVSNSEKKDKNDFEILDAEYEPVKPSNSFNDIGNKKEKDSFDKNFTLSNEEIERKVNERLSNNIVNTEVKKKDDRIDSINKKIDEKLTSFDNSINNKIDKKISEIQENSKKYHYIDDELEDKLAKKIEDTVNDVKAKEEKKNYHYIDDDFKNELINNIEKNVNQVQEKETKKNYHYIDDEFKNELSNKIEESVNQIQGKETKKNYHYIDDEFKNEPSNKIEESVNQIQGKETKKNYHYIDDDFEDELEDKINKKIEEKVNEVQEKETKKIYDYIDDKDEKLEDKISKTVEEKVNEELKNDFTSKTDNKLTEDIKPRKNVLDYEDDLSDYEPFEITKEEEEVLRLIEEKLKEESKQSKSKPNNLKNGDKSSTVINLDDVSDDDKFFDDFFED